MKHNSRESLFVVFAVLAAIWTGFAMTSCGGSGGGGGGGGGGVGIGNITIVKVASPTDAQDFAFTVTGSGLTPFTLDDDGGADSTFSNSKLFNGVSAGTYTVTEAVVSGWNLTTLSCTGGTSITYNMGSRMVTINLKANQDVVCTFTNTKQPPPASGNITIVKDAVPNDTQDFSFTSATLGPFSLDDDADPTLSNTKAFINQPLGVYSVTESATSGWNLTNLDCTGSSDFTPSGSTVSINLQDGEDVVCTFTNTQIPPAIGNITIIKDAVPDDAQDFDFSVTGSGLVPFTLDDDAGAGNDPTFSNSTSTTFNGILAGTYTVTENVTSGWALSDISCTGGASTSVDLAQRKATINLADGEDVVCTFTNDADSKYLYISNTNEDTISAFSLNADTGELTFIGNTTLITNSAPTGLALSPDGMYLYSANSNKTQLFNDGNSTVSVYFINSSGGLEEQGSPFPVNGTASLINLVMHPSGNYLYGTDKYTNSQSSIRAFVVNSTTGGIDEEIPATTLSSAHGIAMHPSGDYFFVSTANAGNRAAGKVFSFDITTLDGTFSEINNATSAAANVWAEVTPDGKYLYTADADLIGFFGGNINGFAINGTTGELSALSSGFPFKPAGISNDVRSLLVEPSGKYIYAADWDTNQVSAFVINSVDGTLSDSVPGTSFATGVQPKALATDSLGRFLYVVNYSSNNVSVFSINQSTGALSFIANTPVGDGPKAIITAP